MNSFNSIFNTDSAPSPDVSNLLCKQNTLSLNEQFLIPGINVFDIDKNLMAKMFPICFSLKKFDT
jgi:hypothetical protein